MAVRVVLPSVTVIVAFVSGAVEAASTIVPDSFASVDASVAFTFCAKPLEPSDTGNVCVVCPGIEKVTV